MSSNYRWPTKVAKFGIQDPFLRFIVAKYENEIPWGTAVDDEATLAEHVAGSMLQRLLDRAAFPPKSSGKHYFVSARHVDLESALAADIDLDETEIGVIRLIREEDGIKEATKALVELVNSQKAAAFSQWTDMLGGQYLSNPAFALLLMRPLFDMAGKGARRSVLPPSTDVIEWLARRITSGRLSPDDSVARVYCWKLASGTNRILANGWQYIPAGVENASELSAACFGSGWCVATRYWASRYLAHSSFYILRSAGQPVVALRSDVSGRSIVECEGRGNDHPYGWCADIDFFTRTQGIDVRHRVEAIRSELSRLGDTAEQPEEWWLDRTRYWPFAAQFAPKALANTLVKKTSAEVTAYLHFPSFESLADRAGFVMEASDWACVLEIDPRRFSQCSQMFQSLPEVRQACTTGWIDRVRDGELTISELGSLPDFVRETPAFWDALEQCFPEALSTTIRRPPRTADERLDRFKLEQVLPAITSEPARLAVERAVNELLTNEKSDFSDEIFPDALRARQDFTTIRREAWEEAVAAQPPLFFALPNDLVGESGFKPREGDVPRVDVHQWAAKVREKPWLLTQQKGVPKSVRYHRQVLDAYRDGWVPFLESSPWRVWVKRGMHRRVYMSYALLADPRTVDAITEGWRRRKDRAYDSWERGSLRMQEMPVLQVAALRALGSRTEVMKNSQALRVCQAIAKRHTESNLCLESDLYAKEVRQLLQDAGWILGST